VNTTVTYKGGGFSYAGAVGVDVVTSKGSAFGADYTISSLYGAPETRMTKGVSLTGSQVFVIPDGDTVSIRVHLGTLGDPVIVKP
jgi:hypothetical protein